MNIKSHLKKIKDAVTKPKTQGRNPFDDISNICNYTGTVCNKPLCDDCMNPQTHRVVVKNENVETPILKPEPTQVEKPEEIDDLLLNPKTIPQETHIIYPWMGWKDVNLKPEKVRPKRPSTHICDFCHEDFAIPEYSTLDNSTDVPKIMRRSKEYYIPYICSYCGGWFCENHRLPEHHDCRGLPDRDWDNYRALKESN